MSLMSDCTVRPFSEKCGSGGGLMGDAIAVSIRDGFMADCVAESR